MSAIVIQASTTIKAPAARVHDALSDFTTWPIWSPWLYVEPDAQVNYTGDKGEPGHGYQWHGDQVGTGNMRITGVAPARINCDLHFVKPFKSTACVWFDLIEEPDGYTRVSWHMDSPLPFFMFWMKQSMSAEIKADYQRGLALLKDYIELGDRQSQTKLVGTANLRQVAYVGQAASSTTEQLADSKTSTFTSLLAMEKSGAFTLSGNPFCIYDQLDLKHDSVKYTVALPVVDPVSVTPPLVCRTRAACHALKAVHIGSYQHLPNAWSMLRSAAKQQKLKLSTTVSPFEFYLNELDSNLPCDLITELCLPLEQ